MACPSAVSCVLLLLVALSHQSVAKGKETGNRGGRDEASKREKRVPQTLSRGWGDDLTWIQTYEEALYRSKTEQRPIMIIHHREDCPHSQALKKAFAADRRIQELAAKFIMLNLIFETSDKHLWPDGQYVPRIMFIDPTLTVRADIPGKYQNRLFAYEPQDMDILYENMKLAAEPLKPKDSFAEQSDL